MARAIQRVGQSACRGTQGMKPQRRIPSADYLRSLFSYDPDSGVLSWKVKRHWKTDVGSVAGIKRTDGYLGVKFDQSTYLVHRVIWALFHGSSPCAMIDHIDGDRANNKIDNLRLADDYQNRWNSAPRPKITATHGHQGVIWNRRCSCWNARIRVLGKLKHLGTFSTADEAASAYKQAAQGNHGSFWRKS